MSNRGCPIVGPSLFVATSFFSVLRQFYLKNKNNNYKLVSMEIDTVMEAVPEKVVVENPIVRNDSEYSLGLNRSESFENLVTSIGPLCSSGQAIWLFTQYSLKGLAIVMIGKLLVDLSAPSNNSDYETRIRQH